MGYRALKQFQKLCMFDNMPESDFTESASM